MRLIDLEGELTRLLTDAKLEPDHLEPWLAWKAFKAFINVPVECERDAASFQCSAEQDEAGAPHFFVEFVRQCSVTEGGEDTPVAGVGIELVYDLEQFPVSDDQQVWSYDYPSFAAFAAHVEALPQFQAAMNQHPSATELWQREV